jgi:hypothetical protein
MNYENLGATIADLQKIQAEKASLFTNPFQWKSEYLPVILGIGGFFVVAYSARLYKKRKKKKI